MRTRTLLTTALTAARSSVSLPRANLCKLVGIAAPRIRAQEFDAACVALALSCSAAPWAVCAAEGCRAVNRTMT